MSIHSYLRTAPGVKRTGDGRPTVNDTARQTLKLAVNGETVELDRPLTLLELLDRFGLKPARVAVEVDRKVVPRASYGDTRVGDGQQVEIVQFVGGG